jgi:hypothetical protein
MVRNARSVATAWPPGRYCGHDRTIEQSSHREPAPLPRPSGLCAIVMRIKRLPTGFIIPAQPVLASRPPAGPGWVHEIERDGCRMIVRRDGAAVRLCSRNGVKVNVSYVDASRCQPHINSLPAFRYAYPSIAGALFRQPVESLGNRRQCLKN